MANSTDVKFVHPWKTPVLLAVLVPIVVKLCGNLTVVKLLQFLNACWLIVVNFVNDVKSAVVIPVAWKALFPIEVKLPNELKSKSVKLAQLKKALFGIDVNLFVPITCVKLVAP